MKKLNKRSDCYFINKIVSFKPLNISKVHLIDEDCNEFTATVAGVDIMKGYVGTNDVKIIDYVEYAPEDWEEMLRYIEYERAIVR